MLTWIARLLLLRRFGGRGLIAIGLFNFLGRRLSRRNPPPGVYEPGVNPPGASEVYQPSQGSSQTVQRRPR